EGDAALARAERRNRYLCKECKEPFQILSDLTRHYDTDRHAAAVKATKALKNDGEESEEAPILILRRSEPESDRSFLRVLKPFGGQ
ncbi:hypothetical protein N0V85_009567, partial [Neurospora sp. IMI 360204]